MPTITWNLASDLLTIKLLIEYPFQKDYITKWNSSLPRKLRLASVQNYYLSNVFLPEVFRFCNALVKRYSTTWE